MMTPEEKANRKAARLERKRLEDMELERQLEELMVKKRAQRPARDSSMRKTLAYNAWQRGQRTGQVFRSHCGR